MGLVTGQGLPPIKNKIGKNLLTVFIPSSPTPITGYTVVVSHDEVIDLPMSIDDALRFAVSAGVILPTRWRDDGSDGAQSLPADH